MEELFDIVPLTALLATTWWLSHKGTKLEARVEALEACVSEYADHERRITRAERTLKDWEKE